MGKYVLKPIEKQDCESCVLFEPCRGDIKKFKNKSTNQTSNDIEDLIIECLELDDCHVEYVPNIIIN